MHELIRSKSVEKKKGKKEKKKERTKERSDLILIDVPFGESESFFIGELVAIENLANSIRRLRFKCIELMIKT